MHAHTLSGRGWGGGTPPESSYMPERMRMPFETHTNTTHPHTADTGSTENVGDPHWGGSASHLAPSLPVGWIVDVSLSLCVESLENRTESHWMQFNLYSSRARGDLIKLVRWLKWMSQKLKGLCHISGKHQLLLFVHVFVFFMIYVTASCKVKLTENLTGSSRGPLIATRGSPSASVEGFRI